MKNERDRRKREKSTPVHWFSSQMPITARAGPGQSWEPVLSLGLPRRDQELHCLSHYLPPPTVSFSRKLQSEVKVRT